MLVVGFFLWAFQFSSHLHYLFKMQSLQYHIDNWWHKKGVFNHKSLRRFPSVQNVIGWLGLVGTRMWVGLEIGSIARLFKKKKKKNGWCGTKISMHKPKYRENINISPIHRQKMSILWKYHASYIFLACIMLEAADIWYIAIFSSLIVWRIEKPSFYNSLGHLRFFGASFPSEKFCFRLGFFLLSLWFL